MTTNNLSLEQAINDLSTIKRAIEVSSHKDGIPKDHSALSVGRVTHIFGAATRGIGHTWATMRTQLPSVPL